MNNRKTMIITTILALLMVLAMAGCGKNSDLSADVTTGIETGTSSQSQEADETGTTVGTTAVQGTADQSGTDSDSNVSDDKLELLQSASVDLDADGVKEEVEVFSARTEAGGEYDAGELEGILKITDGDATRRITFIKKPAGLTGVMTGFEFEDLDGDGTQDVFIVIPESGAAFSINYFFAYSYKTGKSYSFTTDSNLSELAEGFSFRYLGEGKLEITNSSYSFTGIMDISDSPGMEQDEESNKAYEGSWIEPVPTEIGEDSRISLVRSKEGEAGIKVPLPVFGRATADMIGEIDLYYIMGNDFKPVLKSFEVLNFSASGFISAAKWKSE